MDILRVAITRATIAMVAILSIARVAIAMVAIAMVAILSIARRRGPQEPACQRDMISPLVFHSLC